MEEAQEPKYDAIVIPQHTMNLGAKTVIVNRHSGSIIPDDEPVFIFRARDVFSVDIITEYMRRLMDGNQNPQHIDTVGQRLEDFIRFREDNPNRMKEPD